MPSTVSLIDRVAEQFPKLHFAPGEHFEWQPKTGTVVYDEGDPHFEARLLHEIGHATLGHASYERDIDLIACERDAWQSARLELSNLFDVTVPGEVIHHDMDSYRDWLHARSTCPHCQSSGIQIAKREYKCVTCLKTWRVNEARTCQLKRYRV